jgi:hypothetical protein
VTIRRTIAEGNAGNQIKTTGPTILENVVAVGNCGAFEGKPYTYDVDPCRALGNTLSFALGAGDGITVVNSTITGEGDCLVTAECVPGETCSGSEGVLLRNDILVGHPQFGSAGDTTCLAWTDLPSDPFVYDHVIADDLKTLPEPCPPDSLCGDPPGLIDGGIDTFDARLLEDSVAIDAGTIGGAPADDFSGRPRVGPPDIGAYEWRHSLHVPLLLRHSRAQD